MFIAAEFRILSAVKLKIEKEKKEKRRVQQSEKKKDKWGKIRGT